MRLCILLVLAGIVCAGLGGCLKNPSTHPNVLILAVENLNSDDAICSDDVRSGVQSGLDLFCDSAESLGPVSVSSRAALPSMISLLFGLTPEQTKVFTNDGFARAEFESFAEKAHDRGWATGFFGSSPLFMRRSGLAQGFDQFQESREVEAQAWGKRTDGVIHSFLHWQAEQGRSSFYAVLTFSDLNFPWMRTTNFEGQERSRTVEGQIEGLDENWLVLFRALIDRKVWDNTWILVTGVGGRDSLHPRVAGLIKPAVGFEIPERKDETPLTLAQFSRLVHQSILRTHENLAPTLETGLMPALPIVAWPGGSYWVLNTGSKSRSDFLKAKLPEDPALLPWLLLDLLDQNQAKDFIQISAHGGPMDSQAFWDRVLLNKRNQILQDPCLRMIDLKIFEGGGSKTCDSPALLALQDFMRQSDLAADDQHLREAKLRVLRSFHELRAIRKIQMVNFALGNLYPFSLEIGKEILRAEMALRLPDQQAMKNWLDQAESTLMAEPAE